MHFYRIRDLISIRESEVAYRAREREKALKRPPRRTNGVRPGKRPAKALAWLRALPPGAWAPVADLAGAMGWTRSAAGYVLRCLETAGYVETDGKGGWRAKGGVGG